MKTLVHVIIPHFGGEALLNKCLDGVADCNYPHEYMKLHIVDDNESQELFTASVNKALANVEENAVAWILNNDCIPLWNCVQEALHVMVTCPPCACVGSQNRLTAHPDRICWGGSGQCWPHGVHKQGMASKGDLQATTEEPWATFSSVFLNGHALKEIGLLDPKLRHICSDADWCLRAKAAGWHVIHSHASLVLHEMGTSTGKAKRWLREQMAADATYFAEKHGFAKTEYPKTAKSKPKKRKKRKKRKKGRR